MVNASLQPRKNLENPMLVDRAEISPIPKATPLTEFSIPLDSFGEISAMYIQAWSVGAYCTGGVQREVKSDVIRYIIIHVYTSLLLQPGIHLGGAQVWKLSPPPPPPRAMDMLPICIYTYTYTYMYTQEERITLFNMLAHIHTYSK